MSDTAKIVRLLNKGRNRHLTVHPTTGEKILIQPGEFVDVPESLAETLLSQGTKDAPEFVLASQVLPPGPNAQALQDHAAALEKTNASLLEANSAGAELNKALDLRVKGMESLLKKIQTGAIDITDGTSYEEAVANEIAAIAGENAASKEAAAPPKSRRR